MKRTKQIAVILLLAVVITACAGAEESEDSLVGTVWNLTSLNGESLVPTTSITAEFSEDGRAAGSSGCNNYAAAYEVDGSKITFNACRLNCFITC